MSLPVVSRGDSSVVFEFVEEALDQVSLSIDPLAEREAGFSVALWRDDGPGAALIGKAADGISIIGSVGEEDRTFIKVVEQRQCFRAVMVLARRQVEADGPSFGIDDCMDFGRQPTSGAAHSTVFGSFRFFLGAQRHADAPEHENCRS